MGIAAGKAITAQDIFTGMVFTDGKQVFKAARIVPLNIVGKVVKKGDTITVETGATHVQVITRFGHVIFRINDPIVPLVPVSI